jgi:hypothetical protein
MRFCLAMSALAVLALSVESPAAICSFSFSDRVGDQDPYAADVTSLEMTFDNVSGSYVIAITADADNPFHDDFRINVNLFNPDTGSAFQDPAFFMDSANDVVLSEPTTMVRLTGINLRLCRWDIGDRVAINNIPFGGPTDGGVRAFYSGLLQWSVSPAWPRDSIGESPYYTIVFPEPATGVLLSLLSVGCLLRRRGS